MKQAQYQKTGALIAAVRKQKGLTQKALAAQLHISDTTVSKWERGIGFPDVSLIEPLAAALGLSLSSLFAGELVQYPIPQGCETIISEVLAESDRQSRQKRRADRIAFAVAIGILLLIAVPLLFFRTETPAVLCGAYASVPPSMQTVSEEDGRQTILSPAWPAGAVQLSAGWPDENGAGEYVLYLDGRVLEEGSYVDHGDGSFTLFGAWADGTPRSFLIEPTKDGAFRLLLPAWNGGKPILLARVGDTPFSIGTVYGDEAQYRAKYMQPAA